jgi:hypothetical protein
MRTRPALDTSQWRETIDRFPPPLLFPEKGSMMRVSLSKVVPVLAAMIASVISAHAVNGAESPKNPEYVYWQNIKPGTWVEWDAATKIDGKLWWEEERRELVEVKPDKIVLRCESSIFPQGAKDVDVTVSERVVSATLGKDDTAKEIGTEEIKIEGKTYKCKVLQGESDFALPTKSRAKWKAWLSDGVPGGIVKMEVTRPEIDVPTPKMVVTIYTLFKIKLPERPSPTK